MDDRQFASPPGLLARLASARGDHSGELTTLVTHTTLRANGGSVSFIVDFSTTLQERIRYTATFRKAEATASGLRIGVFPIVADGVVADNIEADESFTIPARADETVVSSYSLTTGRYRITITNLDPTNDVVDVTATSGANRCACAEPRPPASNPPRRRHHVQNAAVGGPVDPIFVRSW